MASHRHFTTQYSRLMQPVCLVFPLCFSVDCCLHVVFDKLHHTNAAHELGPTEEMRNRKFKKVKHIP